MNKKKVLFLEPFGTKTNMFAQFGRIPMAGPVSLAARANQEGFEAQVFKEGLSQRQIKDEELIEADILGISSMTSTYNSGVERALRYKRLRQEAGLESRVIAGGIHVSMMPEEAHEVFDQIIVGEADDIIIDVLNGNIPDRIVHGERCDNLARVPFLDFRSVINYEKMRHFPVITSRGCPHGCDFCSVIQMFGRRYRSQSPERVAQELEYVEKILQEIAKNRLWKRIHRDRVFLADDNFPENPKRAEDILDRIIAAGYKRDISCQVRADIAKNPRLVAKMKRAGVDTVYVGCESINQNSLDNSNKRQKVEDIVNAINVFHDNGIMMYAMFIFGFDADTTDIFSSTGEFCKKHDVDFVQYSVLTPLPGTPLFQRIEQEGRLLHKNWDHYDATHAVFQPKNMTALELQEGMLQGYRDFYGTARTLKRAGQYAGNLAKFAVTGGRGHFPSYLPTKYQLIGTYILHKWQELNKEYMSYLKNNPRANTNAS